MDTDALKNTSILGRACYAIMCTEEYLLATAPEKDWTPLCEIMWSIAGDELWDAWLGKMVEVIPENLLEFDSYAESGFEYLREEEYATLKSLYSGMPKGLNTLIDCVLETVNVYAYGSIPGCGQDSLDIVGEAAGVLEDAQVPLPDVEAVAFNSFGQQSGWGENFDFKEKGLSKVIR